MPLVIPQFGQSSVEGIATGGMNGAGAAGAVAVEATIAGATASAVGVEMASDTVLVVVETPEDSYVAVGVALPV